MNETRPSSPHPRSRHGSSAAVRFQNSDKKNSARVLLTVLVLAGFTAVLISSLILLFTNFLNVTVEHVTDLEQIPQSLKDKLEVSHVEELIVAPEKSTMLPKPPTKVTKATKVNKVEATSQNNFEVWWSTPARHDSTFIWSKEKNKRKCCSRIWYFSSYFEMENDENLGKIWISSNNKKFILKSGENWVLALSPSGEKSVLISPEATVDCPDQRCSG